MVDTQMLEVGGTSNIEQERERDKRDTNDADGAGCR